MNQNQPSKITLPIIPTTIAAFRDVLGDIKGFFKISWVIWFVLVLVVELPSFILADKVRKELAEQPAVSATVRDEKSALDSTAPEAGSEKPTLPRTRLSVDVIVATMVLNVAQVLLLFCFSVAWYRQLLLHDDKGKTIPLRFGKREVDYMWTSMKASFAMLPVVLILLGLVTSMAMPDAAAPTPGEQQQNLVLIGLAIAALLYAQARLSMSYALTVVGETQAPVARSWRMTAGQGFPIMLGNVVMIGIPTIIMVAAIMGLSFMMEQAASAAAPEHGGLVPAGSNLGTLALSAGLKAIGAFFTLMTAGMLSAYQARIYALLVRENS